MVTYIVILACILLFYYLFIRPQSIRELFYSEIKIDKVYVINLEESKDRLDVITAQLNKENIAFNRIAGVNGSRLQYDQLYKKKIIKHYNLKKGALGCSLSHISIWKRIIRSKYNNHLVIEDDVILTSNLLQKFKIIQQQIPTNYDIVYFGGSNIHGTKYSKNLITPIMNNKYGSTTNTGMIGMLINKKCVPLLLKYSNPLFTDIDQHIKLLFPKLNIYYIMDPLIHHDNNISSTRLNINNNKSISANIKNIPWFHNIQSNIHIE